MDVASIAPGLWRWSSHYGEWGDVVGSVYCETAEGVVLVDPLVPERPADEARFWRALDRDVERAGGRLHVLVTVFWHARSAGHIAARYGARVYAPGRARAAVERRTGAAVERFRPGDAPVEGVEALPSGRGTEVVFWIPAHATLVSGDVLVGVEGGGLALCPASWLPRGVTHADVRRALWLLLDLPVRHVLPSHGAPVLRGARRALERALAEPG